MSEKETVLVLTSNLFFMPRIEAAAEAGGLDTISASTAAKLNAPTFASPSSDMGYGSPRMLTAPIRTAGVTGGRGG